MNYEKNKEIKEFYRVTAIDWNHCLCEIEDFKTKEEAIERGKQLLDEGRHTCRIERFFRKEDGLYFDATRRIFVKHEDQPW